MKSRRIVGLLLLCELLFCLVLYHFSQEQEEAYFHMVDVNDLVYTMEEAYEDTLEEAYENTLQDTYENTYENTYEDTYKDVIFTEEKRKKIEEVAKQYGMEAALIDLAGNCIYQTDKMKATSLREAVEYGDIILDFEHRDEVIGKVLIQKEGKQEGQTRKNLFIVLFLGSIVLTVGGICYLLYLKNKILDPFQKLRQFAKHIAGGNLDAPLTMDRNNIFGAFTESFDIMREQLQLAKEKEREANESKKELVASLSHDIKTPLASIKAMAEVLLVTMEDQNQKKKVESIEKKIIQIEQLTNNLFHSTLEELQSLKVEPVEVESVIIKDLLETSDYEHRIQNIQIPDCIVSCDPLRLEQVLDNVIYNSYKYANTQIQLRATIKDKSLEVEIQDFGKGVQTEELPLLSQKFYRGNNAKDKNGAGIGLYLSNYFLVQMGGNLQFRNVSDGFVVSITLLLA
ncbi:HAMP domain-containing sensor histidine kinase [Anaerosporobacter faecicola]|uniref:HAMP domain-containing sensor histidine kinase n=1 Tax=Anaerosporobacter faecicola TaxID=2718714 RepID=UPI00143A5887|nr:ATP-binding protein [Anaerosporobacter faecicola]